MIRHQPSIDTKCPICGRNFIPAPMHIFRMDGKLFCRWTCYKKYKDIQENERKKKKDGEEK